jgi:hypothetical protein
MQSFLTPEVARPGEKKQSLEKKCPKLQGKELKQKRPDLNYLNYKSEFNIV